MIDQGLGIFLKIKEFSHKISRGVKTIKECLKKISQKISRGVKTLKDF